MKSLNDLPILADILNKCAAASAPTPILSVRAPKVVNCSPVNDKDVPSALFNDPTKPAAFCKGIPSFPAAVDTAFIAWAAEVAAPPIPFLIVTLTSEANLAPSIRFFINPPSIANDKAFASPVAAFKPAPSLLVPWAAASEYILAADSNSPNTMLNTLPIIGTCSVNVFPNFPNDCIKVPPALFIFSTSLPSPFAALIDWFCFSTLSSINLFWPVRLEARCLNSDSSSLYLKEAAVAEALSFSA